jgi:hypothetical protein
MSEARSTDLVLTTLAAVLSVALLLTLVWQWFH